MVCSLCALSPFLIYFVFLSVSPLPPLGCVFIPVSAPPSVGRVLMALAIWILGTLVGLLSPTIFLAVLYASLSALPLVGRVVVALLLQYWEPWLVFHAHQ